MKVIVGFLAAVALLFVAAISWIGNDATPVSGDARPLPVAEESALLDELDRASAQGSWSEIESARRRALKRLREANRTPSRGTRLYFFPELLDEKSLEADVAHEELKPALEELRTAGGAKERTAAMDTLRSRVENYELGATTDEENLSPEAGRFLGVYGRVK